MADHIKDLYRLPEDERIRIIGETASEGKSVGVMIDDDDAKVERYIKKVIERYPTVCVTRRFSGPTPGVVTIQFGRYGDGR